ncbi:MAG TPA: 50S ribosomal protein L14e [Candidatus Diapherotrites archaeon]|uniref:50S ribosomal protein L14e n=1 Tax=Candidatus Iainarchaeum sp. TaxID=3101447 RepID=A0A7J4J505_9ARCH|nr:50S ribosomal protein L14e [Candidatus Diapherotrites archaeon]
MRALDVGTVCVKTTGREAGKKAVVAQVVDDNFVIIDGADNSGVRRRKCNIAHLIPIGESAQVPPQRERKVKEKRKGKKE